LDWALMRMASSLNNIPIIEMNCSPTIWSNSYHSSILEIHTEVRDKNFFWNQISIDQCQTQDSCTDMESNSQEFTSFWQYFQLHTIYKGGNLNKRNSRLTRLLLNCMHKMLAQGPEETSRRLCRVH
jgi:hypothetical protein